MKTAVSNSHFLNCVQEADAMRETYYEKVGLTENASFKDIKKAYSFT